MRDDVRIDVNSDRQQHSSALIQNNNGNDRSHTSTGVGAQEESIPITGLLEKVAKILGGLACVWVGGVWKHGGIVDTMETKDCGFGTVLLFLACILCCPQVLGYIHRWLLTEATQSLSADYLGIPNNNQQLAVPICYIDTLFYCSRLIFAMISVVLSVMRLASQDFGKEVANKESRDFALKVFYGLTLAEALVVLVAEALSFPIRGNSVGSADGPGDGPGNGPEDSPGDGPEDGPENGPGDGSEDGPGGEPGDGSGDGPKDGPENGPGGEPGDGSGDVPVNQSNECNAVAQMDQPANQSNDYNIEGPADSLPDLRQRRKEKSQPHPACPGKSRCQIKGCIHNSSNTSKVSGLSVGVNRSELLERSRKEE